MTDSARVYTPPDPPGYFDGYVWPMYLKNRQEMDSIVSGIGERPVKDAMCAICDADGIKTVIYWSTYGVYVVETSEMMINKASLCTSIT